MKVQKEGITIIADKEPGKSHGPLFYHTDKYEIIHDQFAIGRDDPWGEFRFHFCEDGKKAEIVEYRKRWICSRCGTEVSKNFRMVLSLRRIL
jgi:hypothetical protein